MSTQIGVSYTQSVKGKVLSKGSGYTYNLFLKMYKIVAISNKGWFLRLVYSAFQDLFSFRRLQKLLGQPPYASCNAVLD